MQNLADWSVESKTIGAQRLAIHELDNHPGIENPSSTPEHLIVAQKYAKMISKNVSAPCTSYVMQHSAYPTMSSI
jgi:hypothetical protein